MNMQRQITGQEQIDAGVSLNITGAMTPYRKRKGSGIFQSHRMKAGMKEKAYDDGHDHETLHVSTASADEMEDEVEIERIDARRDSIAELSVTDTAHIGDLDARRQRGKHRQEVDETDELTEEVCVLPPGKELVQVAPNMGAGGSHHQATSNPNE